MRTAPAVLATLALRVGVGLCLGGLPAFAATTGTQPARHEYETFHDEFTSLAPDSSHVAHVDRLVLRRDVGTLTLGPGTLAWCRKVHGRTRAAVYVGAGTFTYAPPDTVERAQLERYFGAPVVTRAIESAVLVFSDSTLAELQRSLVFASGPVRDKSRHAANQAMHYLSDRRRKLHWVRPEIAEAMLQEQDTGLFYAQLDPVEGPALGFEIDPTAVESVQLWRRRDDSRAGLYDRYQPEVLSQVRPGIAPADSGASVMQFEPRDSSDSRPGVLVRHYDLDLDISTAMRLAARAALDIEAVTPQRWVWLSLDDQADVDSVAWQGGGRSVSFVKFDDSPLLWVRCDPPLAPGERGTLRVKYHSDRLLVRTDDLVLSPSQRAWYPFQDPYQSATFTATYHVPADAQFASSGRRVSREARGLVTTSTYVLDQASRHFGFTVGYFKEASSAPPGVPPVRVMVERDEQDFAAEIAGMVRFMQEAFGPAPFDALAAARNPSTFGVSFPNLVLVGVDPDPDQKTADNRRELHRAHEVAHQWWGVSLDFANYHDQWLSEAFAEFSALWYLQVALRSNQSYLAALDRMRENIVDNRRYVLGGGKQAGPIWLGYRTSTSVTPGDYDLIIYEKGAWVLHMLRTMLLDLDTMKEDRFRGLMRDFYERYRNRKATTADFRDVAEAHAGQDLSWFFDQWVMGTRIPVYRFSYKIQPAPGGQWQVTGRIEQNDVPESFRMPVVLRVDFAHDKFAWVRQWARGRVTEFTLPPSLEKPRRVVFNDMQSVLCEVRK